MTLIRKPVLILYLALVVVLASAMAWTARGRMARTCVSVSGCQTLTAVAMVSADDGWAVGEQGLILHFTGGKWLPVASPTHAYLAALAMPSPEEGWAVGDRGTILHFTAGRWVIQTSPTTWELDSISMLSRDEGWAVGYNGTILDYRDGRWSTQPGPTTRALKSVSMVSVHEGWAVGDTGTVLHFDGNTWVQVTVSNGPHPEEGIRLNSPVTADMTLVAMRPGGDGWAMAGAAYGSIFLRHDASGWHAVINTIQSPAGAVYAFSAVSDREAWAAGLQRLVLGSIVHYQQGQWTVAAIPTCSPLLGISMVSANEGWAVGEHGTMLHFRDGVWSLYAN